MTRGHNFEGESAFAHLHPTVGEYRDEVVGTPVVVRGEHGRIVGVSSEGVVLLRDSIYVALLGVGHEFRDGHLLRAGALRHEQDEQGKGCDEEEQVVDAALPSARC